MIAIVVTQLLISGIPAVLLGLFDTKLSSISYLAGSGLSFVNFMILLWLLRRIFKKKQVALSSLIIIFKYLILGLIIYFVVSRTNLQVYWFGAGLISMIFTLGLHSQKLEMKSTE